MTIKDYSEMLDKNYPDEIGEIETFLRNLDLDNLPKGMFYNRNSFDGANNPEYILTLNYRSDSLPVDLSKTADAILTSNDVRFDNARKHLAQECGVFVGRGMGPNEHLMIISKPALRWLYIQYED